MVQKTLGLNLSNMNDDLRNKYKIKDTVKGVVITGVDAQSPAADKRLAAGDVIVEVSQEQVGNPVTCRSGSTSSRRTAASRRCCWSPMREGELRFVALALQ